MSSQIARAIEDSVRINVAPSIPSELINKMSERYVTAYEKFALQ